MAEAIASTIKMLQLHKSKINLFDSSIDDIKYLLEHCLNNNFVRFGTKSYRQTNGIAMGNRMAPPLAILFMHSIEAASKLAAGSKQLAVNWQAVNWQAVNRLAVNRQ